MKSTFALIVIKLLEKFNPLPARYSYDWPDNISFMTIYSAKFSILKHSVSKFNHIQLFLFFKCKF